MKRQLILPIILGLGGLVTFQPPLATAQVVFTEDFSSGFSKWESVRPHEHYWSIVDGQAEGIVPSLSTIIEMVPKDDWWDESWHNLEYELDFTPLEGVDKNISFGFENLLNWYEIHFLEGFYNLVRLKAGNIPFNQFQASDVVNGQTYHIKIRFNQGLIQVYIDGKLVGDYKDWSFNNNFGKIGIKAGTGAAGPTRVRFDNIKVTLLPEANPQQHLLSVTPFKQSDPAWATHEYDHAQKWSEQPSIKRWGCALTSLAMIMRYHGLSYLPNGTELTPDSLNTWLKSQTDGYLGEGALNWIAATRLTKLISDKYATPKLEYQRLNGSDLSSARQEIKSERPVILEIPGHFLVGNGLENDNNSIIITDPAYTFTKLNQHQKNILSTRVFTPSHTDLSYLLLHFNKPLKITIQDSSGKVLADNNAVAPEQLQADDSTVVEKSQLSYQLVVAKPNTGNYRITVSHTQVTPFTLQVIAYDQAANPSLATFENIASTQPLTFEVDYQKTKPSKIKQHISWTSLRQTLKLLHKQGHLHIRWWQTLDALVHEAERPHLPTRHLCRTLIKQFLKQSWPGISKQGQQKLLQELDSL